MMETPRKFHLNGGRTTGSWRIVRAGAPQISPVCVDMSLYLVGKHCAPAVQRGCGAGGGAVCGSVGAGSSAGAGRSVGGDSAGEGFVGGSSVGGDFVGEVDAGGVAGAGASVGSLTADEVSLTDYGRCNPD